MPLGGIWSNTGAYLISEKVKAKNLGHPKNDQTIEKPITLP
jgi:hypothetical protein